MILLFLMRCYADHKWSREKLKIKYREQNITYLGLNVNMQVYQNINKQ